MSSHWRKNFSIFQNLSHSIPHQKLSNFGLRCGGDQEGGGSDTQNQSGVVFDEKSNGGGPRSQFGREVGFHFFTPSYTKKKDSQNSDLQVSPSFRSNFYTSDRMGMRQVSNDAEFPNEHFDT